MSHVQYYSYWLTANQSMIKNYIRIAYSMVFYSNVVSVNEPTITGSYSISDKFQAIMHDHEDNIAGYICYVHKTQSVASYICKTQYYHYCYEVLP